ncbi:HEAT repeat domain-containing protein [Kitasatospora sp. NPDC087314]|uniref:HEAT repeat domain-containing protein n=1 Tax=Kitasatospora sp. NPDC087314 TaxID=3364068 RepID=UPI00382F4B2B
MVLRELTAGYESDPASAVRAEALTVLTLLDPDPAVTHRRLRSALTDPVPAVRAAAALALVERAEAPYPADVVAVLAEAGGDPEFDAETNEFVPGIGSTEERAWILTEDADALAAVARGWIDRGDHQGRGMRRARQLSEMWRDREDETVGLLTAALPHEHSPWDLGILIGIISRWLPDVCHPDPALADNLLPHTRTDFLAGRKAQTVLGQLGDPRLLTDVPDPSPEALAALAVRTRSPEHQRLALRHPDGTGPDGLYADLSPEDARACPHRAGPDRPFARPVR